MKERGKNRSLPLEDGPGDRIEGLGPGALSLSELLAILMGGKAQSAHVLGVARDLLVTFGSLRGLDGRSVAEISRVRGVGTMRATKLKAALELGKRLMREKRGKKTRISSPEDVYNHLFPVLMSQRQELFVVLLLNGQNELMREVIVSRGSLTSSVIHPREVFRQAIVESSAAIVLAHNHPSGNPFPSREDHRVTSIMKEAGEILGIEVFDHVVIGDGSFVSFKEMGVM